MRRTTRLFLGKKLNALIRKASMEEMTIQRRAIKDVLLKILKIIGQSVAWLLVQCVVLYILGQFNVSIAGLFPIIAYANIKIIVPMFVYRIACRKVIMVYTIVGTIVNNFLEVNSKKWWITIFILYLVYMILTLLGMMDAMGEWFFEGFGVLIFDVWMFPLLWLGELEIWHYIQQRRKLAVE